MTENTRYLRKRDGDPFVYIYTEALMARGDMVECDGPGTVVEDPSVDDALTPLLPPAPPVIPAVDEDPPL